MIYKHYAKKLLKKRNKLRISQQELADLIGITRQSISQIEKGIFIPSHKTYIKIDAYLNLLNPISFLLRFQKFKHVLKNILLFLVFFIIFPIITFILFIYI